ncbi:MAG: sdhC [Burkholderiales bacterium]|jgi:succinate dehydrogenase / fumarate reductase cytochrome b subunit|nr:sdhC [Burkholderiales bacterium]
MQKSTRPKFLNLLILGRDMSITAKASILHRISGFLLFLSIPLILFLLQLSLTSSDFYTSFYSVGSSIQMKLIYLILIAAFMYHMCSGVRFLFLDIDKGADIKTAKATARIVIGLSIILTAILGVLIW